MKFRLTAFFFLFSAALLAQTVVTTTPTYPTQTDSITITFDITRANPTDKPTLSGFTGDVYAHTGVTIKVGSGAPTRWQKVIGTWADNVVQPKLSFEKYNVYKITIVNPRKFYTRGTNVVQANENITELCFVLRNPDGSRKTEDIFVPLYSPGISVIINNPKVDVNFGDPLRSPVFVSAGGKVDISVTAAEVGTKTKSITLFVSGTKKAESSTNNLSYTFFANDYSSGKNEVKVVATDTANLKDSSTFVIMRNPAIKDPPFPTNNQIGINYYETDPSKVTLAFYAPQKNFVYVIGDFNDWKVDTTFYMNRYEPKPDSTIWWITIPNLESGKEYGYQFLIGGSLRVQDPYAEKILDPVYDKHINPPVTPSYPANKTSGIVSVLQTGQQKYSWQVEKFIRPAKEKLVIYELLVRDFVSTQSYKTLKDTISYLKKLGVNAVELMPINEFEGNDSWGYNSMMFFAPDKYYGTKNELKAFIDACHQNGIAVIMDIVLNHAYGQNPMVRMYWDNVNNRPAANNPWFNQQSNFQNPEAHWGYDFNHESRATQYFVDRVIHHWLTEYKFDGFRFDFTKGFGNNFKSMSDLWGSKYDADRIRLLKRMVDKAWLYDPTAIMIFEHLAENSEETELANYGIFLWGNINYNYNEATMGWHDGGKSNFESISYKVRRWNQPNLVGYMESHDEERLMVKNLMYGNLSGSYNIKELNIALQRMKLAGAFFFTVPGPKMIWQFGELGYDVSINYGGRLAPKPIRWNYYTEGPRSRLFKVWSALINLKKNYPAFSSDNFPMSVSGYLKRMWINHSTMNVVIIGNFGVTAGTMQPEFQNTGKWYNYFSGGELNVTNVNMEVSLEPGEFRIYTTQKLPTPEPGILANVKDEITIPSEFKLEQNYPNPFNPTTIISYKIAPINLTTSFFVTLKIYDMLGREAATLVNKLQSAGNYRIELNANQLHFSSGVYFYRIVVSDPSLHSSQNFVQTKKMIFLK